MLAGCAPARSSHTLHLRSLLGAGEDGSYALAEMEYAPDATPAGRAVLIDAAGRERESRPLPGEEVNAAIRSVLAEGDAQRLVTPVFEAPLPEGFAPIDALLPASDRPGEWPIEPAPGATGTLLLALGEGLEGSPQLTATVRLRVPSSRPAADAELLVRRIPWGDRSFLAGIAPLPGGRVALLAWGSVRESGGSVYRVEDLSELRLGAAIAALLDARALEAMERKDYAAATSDLELAVQAEPRDATAHYNLACAYAQTGEEDKAILALGEAIELDPDRLVLHARRDPDLDPIRERVEFKLMIDPGPDERRYR